MDERTGGRIAAGRLADLEHRGRVAEPDEPVALMGKFYERKTRDDGRIGEWVRSSVVGLLLFSVVASSIAGAGTALFCTVILAWTLFPLLVGSRDAMDAGCVFMLVSLGVVVVVALARYGPGALLP